MTRPPNVSWTLLDGPVVEGRADEVLLRGPRDWTHARLLEEVAALGGVLRHLGVGPGVAVPLDLREDTDAVVAALAVARLGGVVPLAAGAAPSPPVACIVSGGSPLSAVARLVRGTPEDPVVEPDLDWAVFLPAGRTDPAPCEVLDPGAAYSLGPEGRSVGEQLALLATTAPPYDAAGLRELLQA